MIYFYTFYALTGFTIVYLWADYIIDNFTKRTIPRWLKPLVCSAFLGFTALFVDKYTDWVAQAINVLFTKMLNGGLNI